MRFLRTLASFQTVLAMLVFSVTIRQKGMARVRQKSMWLSTSPRDLHWGTMLQTSTVRFTEGLGCSRWGAEMNKYGLNVTRPSAVSPVRIARALDAVHTTGLFKG